MICFSNYQTRENEHTGWKKIKVSFINGFFKFRNVRNYIGKFVTYQYLRIKNWKLDQIIKSKDESVHDFHEKSKKNEIIEKLNELVKLFKDEGIRSRNEES